MLPDPSFAAPPPPPYYAVIFSSRRTAGDRGYAAMAERMNALAARQPGYLGFESARGEDGFGITVSYWASPEAIRAWKDHAEHLLAQEAGVREWYQHYELRVARVERAYEGPTGTLHPTAWDAVGGPPSSGGPAGE
jgi:heme-degrading monooxygenase HmoA